MTTASREGLGRDDRSARLEWWLGVGVGVVTLAYLPVLHDLSRAWTNDPEYSHGWFIIPAVAWICWDRRARLPRHLRTSAWGLLLLGLAVAMRLGGRLLNVLPLEQASLIPALLGMAWAIGGRRVLRWAAPMAVLLALMIPLPFFIAVRYAGSLQRIAASGASYVLQSLGIPAYARDKVIQLQGDQIDVAYACSGLQMMIAFLAVTTAIALLTHYRKLGKLLVVASAVPIAILCNILRIAATGVGYRLFEAQEVRLRLHDLGGFVLIFVAVGLVLLELHVFERAFPQPPTGHAETDGGSRRRGRSASVSA